MFRYQLRTIFSVRDYISLKTIQYAFEAELIEKSSRFISSFVPIDDFEASLQELKVAHPKASHHVTAFRTIDDNNQIAESAKDDGEPAGTSGMPVLKTLIGADLIDVGMIVTRYFGGTKLGTGGLARAYAGASNLAIQKANLVEWKRIARLEYETSFANSSEVERQIKLANLNVLDRDFNAQGVVFQLEGAEDDLQAFQMSLSN